MQTTDRRTFVKAAALAAVATPASTVAIESGGRTQSATEEKAVPQRALPVPADSPAFGWHGCTRSWEGTLQAGVCPDS